MSIEPFIILDPYDPGGGVGGGGSGGGGTGGGEYDIPGQLPGLAIYGRRRYTCNLAVTEKVKGIDLINEVINLSSRMYFTQGWNGKIRLHNKKPVTFGFGTTAYAIGDTVLDLDDVSGWIGNLSGKVVIDPHTNKSEARTVTEALYAAAQNSVTLTTNNAPDVVITGFAGGDGASTPATATVVIAGVDAGSTYQLVLDGITTSWVPTTGDTIQSIASFLAFTLKGNPRLTRRFSFAWDGNATITITAKFGTLEVETALEIAHDAPVADPTTAPVLTAVAGGPLAAGVYRVAYSFKDEDGGQTLLSPVAQITIPADYDISVATVTPPADCTVCWYLTVAPVLLYAEPKIRLHSENDGTGFTFGRLPTLDDPYQPDLNRTGTEVMRVAKGFSDRADTRADTNSSDVLRGTFEWSLSDQKKRYNRVDLEYREASEDFRRVELRFNDREHQRKVKKPEPEEVNGNAIDNFFQAERIGAGLIAENRDSFFRYKWASTREALLLEEGDVVAITDGGTGVHNLPVMVESRVANLNKAGLPSVTFTARVFANTLYDDSPVERTIPVIAEAEPLGTASQYRLVATPGTVSIGTPKGAATFAYSVLIAEGGTVIITGGIADLQYD